MLHTVLFRVEPTHVRDPLVVYMDLETNSLDVLSGKIVEIGALVEGHGFMFSTVVNPGQDESTDQELYKSFSWCMRPGWNYFKCRYFD